LDRHSQFADLASAAAAAAADASLTMSAALADARPPPPSPEPPPPIGAMRQLGRRSSSCGSLFGSGNGGMLALPAPSAWSPQPAPVDGWWAAQQTLMSTNPFDDTSPEWVRF
jgi:hypothetical protein